LRASDVACSSDVYCVSDVTPDGIVGKHHSFATKSEIWYNIHYLAGKIVYKKDEKSLVLFDFL